MQSASTAPELGRSQLGCVHRHGGQRWKTQEHSEEKEAMSASTPTGKRGDRVEAHRSRGSMFSPYVPFHKSPSGLRRISQTLTYHLIQRLFSDPPDTRGFCLLFHLITYLQIVQETLEVKSSLRCIPIVIGPNVFKSSGRKYTIMILCKQRGKTLNVFTNTRRRNRKGYKLASRTLECLSTGWPLGEGLRFRRMTVTKNKFSQS